MCDLIFRKAEEKDIDELAKLDFLCFSAPWSKEAFNHEIKENPLALYIVCEVAKTGKIAGYAGLWMIYNEGHITNIAVNPEFRKKGIGNRTVIALIQEAKRKGAKEFTLEVRASNNIAIQMYEKLGFLLAGTRKAYYTDNNEDAIIMWTNNKEGI